MTARLATVCGLSAILLWSILALLTVAAGAVPPFLLTAICFATATLVGAVDLWWRGTPLTVLKQPAGVWLLGVGGLFGYHAAYFIALQNAPAAEASLIAYLWPLLIVVFSALLPGERLRWFHVAGALLGLAGLVTLIGGRIGGGNALGYGAAIICAVIWSTYSVGSRFVASVPTAAVTGFCAATAVLSTIAHLVFEQTVWPSGIGAWLAVLGLGLGPVGAAFYLWDVGMKRGRIQLLGASSYATPVLSVIILVMAGAAEPGWRLAIATLLVTAGAVVAAKDLLRA